MTASEHELEINRKLLAKVGRAAPLAEVGVYNEKELELMARHGVDSVLLAAPERATDHG